MSSMMCGMLLGAGVSAKKTYVDDVFNTYLYKGTDGAMTANTGLDMSGEGGMIWIKSRSNANQHILFDTERGVNKSLTSNSAAAEATPTFAGGYNQTFTSTGFTQNNYYNDTNESSRTYSSFNFRKAPGFFDVVTYTGNSTAGRTINHSLGSVPGMIIVKSRAINDWYVLHRGTHNTSPEDYVLFLNGTDARMDANLFNDTLPTSTNFTLGSGEQVNGSGIDYVAYVFAGGESNASEARSVDFDGNDSLTLAASNDFHCTGDLTIEGWFKPNTLYERLFGLGDKGGAFGINVYFDDDTVKMEHSGAHKMGAVAPELGKGRWIHVALVRSGTTVTLYINGTSRATYSESNDFGGAADSQKTFCVGGGLHNGSPWEQFDGKISNFRVVNGTAVYTSSFRPPTEPLTNITNTKLLCCNNSSTTGSTVTPGTITANGDPTASTDSPFDDPAGFVFGANEDQNVIKCGSYVGSGSAGLEVNLGWEPSWVLMKKTTGTVRNWVILDSMRGFPTGGTDAELYPNITSAEVDDTDRVDLTSTGFKITTTSTGWNSNGDTFIFCAIRRPDGYVGKPIEIATSAFTMDTGNSSSTIPTMDSGFPVDFALLKRPTTSYYWYAYARLMGPKNLEANSNNDESDDPNNGVFDSNAGFIANSNVNSTFQSWMFKRHAGFDVVTYKGTGAARQIPHSLSKTPEMMWVKNRDSSSDWQVYHKNGNNSNSNDPELFYLKLDQTSPAYSATDRWNQIAPTAACFSIGSATQTNNSGDSFIAMLFASVDGMSKCGGYSGGSSDLDLELGFAARFFLTKRINQTGSWCVYDTLRGIATGNDKRLFLNTNDAQTEADYVDPYSNGITLVAGVSDFTYSTSSSDKYIFYAHA